MMQSLFKKLATYNARMNQQICETIEGLSNEVLWQDKGAEFSSILGTMNHIMVIDLILLARLNTHPCHSVGFDSLKKLADYPPIEGIRQALFPSLPDFIKARQSLDALISDFVRETVEADYSVALTCEQSADYNSANNPIVTQPFYLLMQDLFNHQTHHRGQLTTLLNQMGIRLKETDFLVLIAEE